MDFDLLMFSGLKIFLDEFIVLKFGESVGSSRCSLNFLDSCAFSKSRFGFFIFLLSFIFHMVLLEHRPKLVDGDFASIKDQSSYLPIM